VEKHKGLSIVVLAVMMASYLVGCASVAVPPNDQTPTIPEASVQPQTVVQTKVDSTPRIAVISAVEDEMTLLLSEADIEDTYAIAGTNYHVGKLRGNDVLMFLSGMSMTNAAMKTQAAIDYFNVERIVYSGIAGGVNPNLNIGDVAVPAKWGEYLDSYFAREVSPGVFEPPSWIVPEFPNYQWIFPRSQLAVRDGGEPDLYESIFWFEADPEMLSVARLAADSVELENCVDDGCLSEQPRIRVGGNGVSGPAFVDNKAFREWVWDTFQADALDTESAATAHVAYTNEVPYIAFRSLSDLAGGDLGDNVVWVFFGLASDNSAKLVLAFLEAWASGVRAEPVETLKAAFVYVGPVGDHGWTFAHDQGRLYLEANVENVETTYLESVSDVDAEARIRDLAEQGYDVIFTTSFSFRDATAAVAPDYPDVIFENCSGFLTAENMGSYFGRMYQGKYLAGIVGGMTTQTNKIGYVAPIQIPEVIRLINGVTLGARSVNPDVQMEVVWIGNWFDPPAETAAVQSMVDAGVDVIYTGTDTTVPVVTAAEEGVWSVGYDSCESCDAAPESCLTTPCWNWGPTYVEIVEAIRDGTWEPEATYEAMSTDIVKLTEINPAAAEGSQAAVEEARAMIEGGQDVFCGPLYDNHGELRVPEGECMADMDLICFDWYVEGVNSEVPAGVGCE